VRSPPEGVDLAPDQRLARLAFSATGVGGGPIAGCAWSDAWHTSRRRQTGCCCSRRGCWGCGVGAAAQSWLAWRRLGLIGAGHDPRVLCLNRLPAARGPFGLRACGCCVSEAIGVPQPSRTKGWGCSGADERRVVGNCGLPCRTTRPTSPADRIVVKSRKTSRRGGSYLVCIPSPT